MRRRQHEKRLPGGGWVPAHGAFWRGPPPRKSARRAGLRALDRVKSMAPQHPEWQSKEPFKSILIRDLMGISAAGEHALIELVVATFRPDDRRIRVSSPRL